MQTLVHTQKVTLILTIRAEHKGTQEQRLNTKQTERQLVVQAKIPNESVTRNEMKRDPGAANKGEGGQQ